MALIPNTDYVYEFGGNLFVTHHTENNHLKDCLKLTNVDPTRYCTTWTYSPTSSSHKNIVFHELETFKSQHIEYFV